MDLPSTTLEINPLEIFVEETYADILTDHIHTNISRASVVVVHDVLLSNKSVLAHTR